MNRVRFVFFCLLVLMFGRRQFAFAQNEAEPAGTPPRPAMTAVRMDEGERVVLDGILDEQFWQRAEPATNFIQQEPRIGEPTTEQTEVRIVFNRGQLYLGIICFDSEPDQLIGFQLRRDEGLGSDDRFQWTMDTFMTGREGYFFEINPSGLMADALLTAGGGQNRQLDGIWTAKVRRSEIGWTAEIEIPFQTLNFDPQADTTPTAPLALRRPGRLRPPLRWPRVPCRCPRA